MTADQYAEKNCGIKFYLAGEHTAMRVTILRHLVYLLTLACSVPALGEFFSACPSPEDTALPALEAVHLQKDGSFRVTWNHTSANPIPASQSVTLGARFSVVRCIPPGDWVTLGHGTFTDATDLRAIGQVNAVQEPAKPDARGNLYWRPMAGDFIQEEPVNITWNPRISPKITIPLHNVFRRDEQGRPTLEIDTDGKLRLVEAGRHFLGMWGSLAVEVHTRAMGSRTIHQEEAQIRAHTIARLLISQLQLPENRVIPIGIGSHEMSGGMVNVDDATTTDFLILRLISIPEDQVF